MNNPWAQLPNKQPYVLTSDAYYIERFNQTTDLDHQIHTEILPEPFLGSLEKASLVLLNLNPGFDDQDLIWHKRPDFVQENAKNLLHESNPPFYLLNQKFSNSAGYMWWYKHLKELVEKKGLEDVANSTMCIEFFPYHSRRFKRIGKKVLPDKYLPSQQYSFDLVRRAILMNKTILIMRCEKTWIEAVPELVNYGYFRINNWQSPYVSRNNTSQGFFNTIL